MSYKVYVDDENVIHYSENGVEFFSMKEAINEDSGEIEIGFIGQLKYEIAISVLDELMAFASMDKNIRIDMQQLTEISKKAQECLLTLQQSMDDSGKGRLLLCNIPRDIMAEFERIGLSQLLRIE